MAGWIPRLIPLLLVCGAAVASEPPGIWLDVPFVKQARNGCGAASIAMVLQYWQNQHRGTGAVPEVAEIQRTLYSRRARGIYASDLEEYFRQHGFRTFAIQGQWDDLSQHLEKGRPLIVALRPGGGALHFVVVTGIDRRQEIVMKNDASRRKLLQQRRAEFEKEWKLAGNWTLLAVPESDRSSSP